MHANLKPALQNTVSGTTAARELGKCVHCGFCNATCPTYQILGDELDGPRGRIYLMKQYLEGESDADAVFPHIDRCLTCRACETTCPSGVTYSSLLDVTKAQLAQDKVAPFKQLWRRVLIGFMQSRALFGLAIACGRLMRPLLPRSVQQRVPLARPTGSVPAVRHPQQVLLLKGCVQPALNGGIDAATLRVLDSVQISCLEIQDSGCCGAMHLHYGSHDKGLAQVRRNIDAWEPLLDQVTAITNNASGCGITVKDYGRLLAHDPDYAVRAARISELFRDVSELVNEQLALLKKQIPPLKARASFQAPCTLQHGLKSRHTVVDLLRTLGADVLEPRDAHLCCGSAGMYSITQPELSSTLRDQKLATLKETGGQIILTANIGCQMHLQSGTEQIVLHWIEWLDQHLQKSGQAHSMEAG